jgi:hypothetical protein
MPAAAQTNSRPKSMGLAAPSAQPRQSKNKKSSAQLQLLRQSTPAKSQGLRLLVKLRQLTTPVVLVTVLGILPLYGWSVTTQRAWGQRYENLDKLQRDTQHWLTQNETLKHDVTRQAELNPKGYIPQGPANSIFLPQMQPRTGKAPIAIVKSQPNSMVNAPLAY